MLTDITAVTGNAWTLGINDSPVIPDVLRFRGTEALSKLFSWCIEFTTPQSNILPEQVLMKYASFTMRNSKVVHGIITRLEWLSTSADESYYSVTLESRLALLSRSRRSALYQNLSVPEVVEQVLRKHGLEGADFEFRLSRQYPVRELITQWRETDLEFIQRILSEVGIRFRQTMNDVTEMDVTVFGDSQLHYLFNGALPYHEPSGMYDGEELCCWGVRTWHSTVTGTVSTRDYNPRTASETMDTAVSVRSPAITTGEHYRYAEPYRDAAAALRFFRKAIRHHGKPEVVTIDKSGANTAALAELNAGKPDEETITVRQSKYLNNLVEQDHRNIRWRTRPMLGFKSFRRALS